MTLIFGFSRFSLGIDSNFSDLTNPFSCAMIRSLLYKFTSMPSIQEHIFIKKPDYRISPKELAKNCFELLNYNCQYIADNVKAARSLQEKILRGEIRSSNFFNLLRENLSLFSEASGIESRKGEILNYSKLLDFLKAFEKLVKQ